MLSENAINIPERDLQVAVHFIISNPGRIFTTESGARLQVLSPGRINPAEGPDFQDIALLLRGDILVGNSEFHRKSSDWYAHRHEDNPEYQKIVLHIVLEDDKPLPAPIETLVLDFDSIKTNLDEARISRKEMIDSIEELQHYSLLRLLRRTAAAQRILNGADLKATMLHLFRDFLGRYLKKRRRPVYNSKFVDFFMSRLPFSPVYQFLTGICEGKLDLARDMMDLTKRNIAGEGAHLRREMLQNCVLPLALCLAGGRQRIELFMWYWSTPALNKYGVLTRRFPQLPQNYIWQQQGMLEYIKEHHRPGAKSPQRLNDYDFEDVLRFYQTGFDTIVD